MNRHINTLLDETIALQLKTGEFYHHLWHLFPDDHTLWANLCAHLECNALRFTAAKDSLSGENIFSSFSIDPEADAIHRAIGKIDATIDAYRLTRPKKVNALARALEIEAMRKEIFFSFANNLPLNTLMMELLRDIIGENKFHADTIEEMLRKSRRPASPEIIRQPAEVRMEVAFD